MEAARKESSPTEDSPFLPPLDPGHQMVCEIEKVCSVCGAMYYRRTSVSPTGLLDAVRTKCKCFDRRDPKDELRERIDKARRIQEVADRVFTHWDLLKDEACSHMRIEKFKPEHETHRQALAIAREFKPAVNSLIFFGRGGRGKTHLAVSIARKARQMGFSALPIKSIDLLNRLRRCYNSKDPDDEVEVIVTLKHVDLLVIDDIGTEKPNHWVQEKLYEVIDHRYNRRSTIYTTNLDGKEMENRLGQGITSRVFGTRQIEMLGEDWRIKQWSDIGREIDYK